MPKILISGSILALTLLSGVFLFGTAAEAAACSVPNALGTVTYQVTIDQPGEYKAWMRLRPDSNNADTMYLEIDGNTCLLVGADDNLADKAWTWVDFGGQGPNKKQLLHKFESAGPHTIKVISNESGVGADRLLLLAASDACVPDNKQEGAAQPGDNCKSEEVTATPLENNPAIAAAESAKPKNKPMSTTTKVLIALGSLPLIAGAAFGGRWLWRRYRNRGKLPPRDPDATVILPK